MILFNFLRKPKVQYSRAYIAYHLSAAWQVVRAHCIIRAQGICERCHHAVVREVHMKTYASNLWTTQAKDCEALCPACHKIRDEERRQKRKANGI